MTTHARVWLASAGLLAVGVWSLVYSYVAWRQDLTPPRPPRSPAAMH